MSEHPATPSAGLPERPALDLNEHGAPREGVPQVMNRRIYFQLLVYTASLNHAPVIEALRTLSLESVLYQSFQDPTGLGILLMAEDPMQIINASRHLKRHEAFKLLTILPDWTMTGRTYSTGREKDLEDWMLRKPRRNALNPALPWAIWYPLRRKPEFAKLTREEQGKLMAEHAAIGYQFAEGGHAFDIRLNTFGLDKNDNEFVIGLVGPELYPLSRIVQDMRKTEQTARYIQSLGPFFIGRVLWQSPLKDKL